jgi:hypothetical protein
MLIDAGSQTLTAPGGWTQITPSGTGLKDANLYSYWTAAGSVANFGWSWTTNAAYVLHILCFSGRSGTVTGSAQFDNGAGGTITATSQTAANGDDLLLSFLESGGAVVSTFGTNPSPSGTTRADTYTGSQGASLAATTDNLSAGATGNYTLAGLGTFNDRQGCLMLLPATTATGITTAWIRA